MTWHRPDPAVGSPPPGLSLALTGTESLAAWHRPSLTESVRTHLACVQEPLTVKGLAPPPDSLPLFLDAGRWMEQLKRAVFPSSKTFLSICLFVNILSR